MQTEDESLKPNPAWKVALVVVPLFLVLSGAGAMWWWWKKSGETAPDPRLALAASEVRAVELDDHLRKMGELIGPRNWETPAGRKSLRRALAFLEGILSPHNYGFAVEKGAHLSLLDESWPTIWVDLRGTESAGEVVFVTAPYDRSGASVAAVLGAVNDLRDEEMRRTVRFLFYPETLYRSEAGREVAAVLKDGESAVAVLRPELPATDAVPGGAELVPVARDLIGKVRDLAGVDRKMP